MSKILYNYDQETGEFLSSLKAQINPISSEKKGKDVYFERAYATDKKPPKVKKNEVAVFNGKGWDIKTDFRGVVFFNKSGDISEIINIDECVPNDCSLTLPELNYQEKRRLEYPPFEDYLDGVVKNDQKQIQDYINRCLAVKAKYPKE